MESNFPLSPFFSRKSNVPLSFSIGSLSLLRCRKSNEDERFDVLLLLLLFLSCYLESPFSPFSGGEEEGKSPFLVAKPRAIKVVQEKRESKGQ